MDHFSRSKYRFGSNIYPYISFSAIIYCQAKQRSRKSKILLIALCMTELTFVVVNFSEELCYIVKLQKAANALYIFLFASVSTMYILIMFLITKDRFLVIYLNIKYDILWSPKKAMIVLSVLLIVCSLLLAPSYVIGLKKVERIGSLYIIPIFEAIFIISASATCFYIFKQVYETEEI